MDHIHRIIYGKLRLENALEVPKTGGYYSNFEIGDEVLLAPVEGGPVGYICTGAGSPGTWLPFGYVGEQA